MDPERCPEFEAWLDRLPRRELSPAFRRHLEECECCRKMVEELEPVIEALEAAPPPPALSEVKLDAMTRAARQSADRRAKRTLILRLGLLSLLSLPVVVLVNWLAASLGYNYIADHASAFLAKTYLVMFVAVGAGISGLTYAFLFLMAGMMRGQRPQETMR
jgi:anti-sigma factor RsiW